MNEFREAFRIVAKKATKSLNAPAILKYTDEKDTLLIPKQRENGFSIELECYDYGVYPSTEGWHGGCWDVTIYEPNALTNELNEFISSITLDAILEVHLSNKKPYKWVLVHQSEGETINDTTGLLFFNWLGKRHVKKYSNWN